jgi:endonuclease/exonuclease/phosphatase family metal-dependent hydrolase
MFGLQSLRVLLPSLVGYLRDSQGVDALSLAPLAVGIFALSFLAGLLRRAVGPRTMWITAAGLGVVRLMEQISTTPSVDLVLSATGVVLFLLHIPNALGTTRSMAAGHRAPGSGGWGIAFLLGVSADTAIHVGARTLDLSWQPGIVPTAIIAVLVVGLLVALRAQRPPASTQGHCDAGWRSAWALGALGPWLFLQLLVYQNVARVSALTSWETPTAGALVVAGNALGLAAAAWVGHQDWRARETALATGLLLTGSLLYPEPTGVAAPLLVVLGQVLGAVLITTALRAQDQDVKHTGITRATITHGVGQILFVLITFVYYVTYDFVLGFRAPVLLPIAALIACSLAVLATTGARHGELATTARWQADYRPAIIALALLTIPLALAVTWHRPQFGQPDPGNKQVRVIDYNLHNGFNTSGRLDLEALAQVIESSDADVVGLQEISRGWVIWGSVDMLTWFSQRLDMPYVSGPTADAQWGNAILSHYPIIASETHRLPPDTVCILRGYIRAQIDAGGGRLTLIDTHFSHRSKNEAARLMQAQALADAWQAAPAHVITGDLNAAPDSSSMSVLLGAGLVNVATEIGTTPILTSPAANPRRQIDYILASPDLGYSDLEIVQSQASDHFPVVATILLP